MSVQPRAGWAVRRDQGCLHTKLGFEVGHHTWGDWWACCPPKTQWKTAGVEQNNTRCDYGDTTGDSSPVQCANSSLSLWWQAGYFCCEENLMGYTYSDDSSGCATKAEVSLGKDNGTMSPAAQQDNPPAATTSAASSGSGSSTNKGAIAGGVVGGFCGALILVGIIWFLNRRRRRSRASKPEEALTDSDNPILNPASHSGSGPTELGDGHMLTELDDSPSRKELPADTQPPQELSGNLPRINQQSPAELY